MEGRPASRRHLPMDDVIGTDLHRRTHPLPDLNERGPVEQADDVTQPGLSSGQFPFHLRRLGGGRLPQPGRGPQRGPDPAGAVGVPLLDRPTPEGSTSRPSRALTSVLLPRLASPATRTRNRAASIRSSTAASCSRSRSVPSAASSSSALTSVLSLSGIAAILLPAH